MNRSSYIPPDKQFVLDMTAREVEAAYGGYGLYLVGSCLTRPDYNDVDVRSILEDDTFEALFPKDPETHMRPRFQITCLAMSAWFRHMTGLPVDFQFQKFSVANEKHGKPKQRVPLGHNAFVGDAN